MDERTACKVDGEGDTVHDGPDRIFSPHLVSFYLHDELAARLHTYYNAERFLVDDDRVKIARLALVAATRQVLANGLAVLGVSAPEKM